MSMHFCYFKFLVFPTVENSQSTTTGANAIAVVLVSSIVGTAVGILIAMIAVTIFCIKKRKYMSRGIIRIFLNVYIHFAKGTTSICSNPAYRQGS